MAGKRVESDWKEAGWIGDPKSLACFSYSVGLHKRFAVMAQKIMEGPTAWFEA
jgi:hypothetical protein